MGDIELVVLHIHMGQWDCIIGYSNDKVVQRHQCLTLWKATPLMFPKNGTPFWHMVFFSFFFRKNILSLVMNNITKNLTYHQATIDLVHSSLGPIPQHSTTR